MEAVENGVNWAQRLCLYAQLYLIYQKGLAPRTDENFRDLQKMCERRISQVFRKCESVYFASAKDFGWGFRRL